MTVDIISVSRYNIYDNTNRSLLERKLSLNEGSTARNSFTRSVNLPLGILHILLIVGLLMETFVTGILMSCLPNKSGKGLLFHYMTMINHFNIPI